MKITKTITMPAGAVLSVPVEIDPQAVVDDTVVFRKRGGGIDQGRMRQVAQIPVFRRQARLQNRLLENLAGPLFPGRGRPERFEEDRGSGYEFFAVAGFVCSYRARPVPAGRPGRDDGPGTGPGSGTPVPER